MHPSLIRYTIQPDALHFSAAAGKHYILKEKTASGLDATIVPYLENSICRKKSCGSKKLQQQTFVMAEKRGAAKQIRRYPFG